MLALALFPGTLAAALVRIGGVALGNLGSLLRSGAAPVRLGVLLDLDGLGGRLPGALGRPAAHDPDELLDHLVRGI
ncbi:hypothetical protein ARTHRO9AX_10374 [Arthrobacter sp. 9AX]|nr:hypothetical protein ARTHRO9AX_10374 [Arthrobacter sp. 9AX]